MLNIVWGAIGALAGLVVLVVFGIVGTTIRRPNLMQPSRCPLLEWLAGPFRSSCCSPVCSVDCRWHRAAQVQALVANPNHCGLGLPLAEHPFRDCARDLWPLGAMFPGQPTFPCSIAGLLSKSLRYKTSEASCFASTHQNSHTPRIFPLTLATGIPTVSSV